MIVAGNGIYDRCADCGKLVKINKFIFGSMHICTGHVERMEAQQRVMRMQANQALQAQTTLLNKGETNDK